jgi:4-amino-4-deoxy-L-arabinose transferase-like glycosyltransferase
VNPVLAGIGALLTYLIGWRLYDRRTGLLTAGLLAASPWYLFLGMSLMTHLSSFVFAAGAVDAVLRWRASRRTPWLFAAGVLVGGVGLVRPLEAVVVGGLLGAAVLWLARRERLVVSALSLGAGAILATSVLIPYHLALTGSVTTFPINSYVDTVYEPGANSLGFGPNRGLGWTGLDPFPGHGARDVVVNLVLNGHATDVELFGWATGAWFLLLGAVLLRRLSATDWWVVAGFALPVAIHVPYWFAGGPDFGARYWFMLILPAVLLAARGLSGGGGRWPALSMIGLAVMGWSAAVTFLPWRSIDKYHGYRGMRPWARELAADPAYGNALLLVRGDRQPDFASAVIYNPLDLSGPFPVFSWYRDEFARDSAVAAFPERDLYVVDGPTVTGGEIRITAVSEGGLP